MSQLQSKQKGYGDKVGEQQKPGTACLHEEEKLILFPWSVISFLDVVDFLGIIPNGGKSGRNNAQRELDDKDNNDELIGADFDI